jgi:gliding motility-associated-like protein
MRHIALRLLVLVAALYFPTIALAQPGCPFVDAGNPQSVNCNINCVDLVADYLETGATTSYTVEAVPYAPPVPYTGGTQQFINTDDIWGSVIDLPFNFCFYGTQYDQVVIGANGLVSFDVSVAGTGCAWAFTASIPSATLYTNCIMGAYHDIDPSYGGTISYFIQGTAPCRIFGVSFDNVPHFDCNCGLFAGCSHTTQQIVIYETTNIIEVYLAQKETCAGWNSGNAVVGVQNATGTAGVTPPGRNTGPWTATNEGWRFLPSGAPTYQINWYEAGAIIGTGPTINVCPSATTTYTSEAIYTACDGNVVTVTDQVTVTQNSTMTASVTPSSATLCPGESVVLTASSSNAGVTYSWSPSTGLSATTGATVTASPLVPTVYTVTADDGSCTASANATISMGTISVTTSVTPVGCGGNNGTATATAVGAINPISYAWTTTPVQTTQTATGLAVGTYDVTVTDGSGCSATETVTIVAGNNSITAPTMTSTDAICTADNGTATATPVDGTAPFTYEWNTTPVQTTQTATGLAPGIYQISLTDASGCTIDETVTVGLTQTIISATITSTTDASCAGICDGAATVSAQNGTAPYLIVWDDPTNQTTLTATDLCAGTYNVGVMDANGCVISAQATIAEPAAIQANATMTRQSDCGQPNGETNVAATGGDVAVDYDYLWETVPVQTTADAVGLLPGSYDVTVSDDNGCSVTASVTVTSTPSFTAGINAFSDALCFNSCTGTASVNVDNIAVAPLTYAWSTVPVQTTANAVGLCAGDYDVTVTDDLGCIATANVTIGEPAQITVSASVDLATICIGGSAQLSASANGGTLPYAGYLWNAVPADASLVATDQNPVVSPMMNTTYSVVAADANGCTSAPSIVTVQLRAPLTLDIIRPLAGPDTSICYGDIATLDLVATGGDGNYTFFLAPDPTPLALPLTVNPLTTTVYDFAVVDGCTTPPAIASSTITVDPLPVVNFTVDAPDGCDEHTAVFTDMSTPPAQQWLWNFGDAQSNANSATQSVANHTFTGPGIYDIALQVTTAAGCTNDTIFPQYIEVYALPQANFTADPLLTDLLNPTIHFTDVSIGDIATWNWTFGDGGQSSSVNPTHSYQDTGTFIITLFVTTVDGCTDQVRNTVEIIPNYMFYIPNSFTPNSDGKNDFFRPYGEGVLWETLEMLVFDRWGEQIFTTGDIENPWDGSYMGAQVESGVYVYHISITDANFETHTYIGNVNLVR